MSDQDTPKLTRSGRIRLSEKEIKQVYTEFGDTEFTSKHYTVVTTGRIKFELDMKHNMFYVSRRFSIDNPKNKREIP